MKKRIEVWIMSTYFNEEIPHYSRFFEEQSQKLKITIDMKVIAWNKAYDKLIDAFKHNQPPDLFQIGSTWISTFVNLGYLAPIPRDMFQHKYISPWVQGCAMYNQQQYAIPWFSEPHILMGNDRIIQQYSSLNHSPVNWETFYNHCSDLHRHSKKSENSFSPFTFLVKGDLYILHTFFAWLYKGGFSFPSPDKLELDLLNVKLMEETFQYIFSLIDLGNYGNTPKDKIQNKTSSEYGAQSYSKFYDLQQSAFITSSGVNVIGDTLRKLHAGVDASQPYSIYPIPHKETFQPTNGGGVYLGISEASENKSEIYQLAQEMMSTEFLEAWMLASGNMPVFEHELWDKYEGNSLIASLKTEIACTKSYPFHPMWRNIEAILAKGISALFWDLQTNKIKIHQVGDQIHWMNQKINEMIHVTWNRR